MDLINSLPTLIALKAINTIRKHSQKHKKFNSWSSNCIYNIPSSYMTVYNGETGVSIETRVSKEIAPSQLILRITSIVKIPETVDSEDDNLLSDFENNKIIISVWLLPYCHTFS